jgi:endoribonuclease Dicer
VEASEVSLTRKLFNLYFCVVKAEIIQVFEDGKFSIFYKMLTYLLGGIKFVEWIGILPASENVQNLIESSVVDPILDKNATLANVNFHLPQWQEFEKRLGYHFNNRAFLLQALTHSSYSPNRVTQSYERLEFIGDAILDFLITCYIYEHCGVLNPGEVTDLRSALVNNNTFASLVVRCGFHKFLLMINLKLQGHIDKFAEYLATKNHVIDDEVLILLEEKDLNMAEYVDVPKVCKVRS